MNIQQTDDGTKVLQQDAQKSQAETIPEQVVSAPLPEPTRDASNTERHSGSAPEDDFPLLLWQELTDEQRGDLKLLRRQLSWHEEALQQVRSAELRSKIERNYTEIKAGVQAREAELKKELTSKRKEHKKLDEEEIYDQFVVIYRDFLKQHEIFYVASLHVYMEYFPEDGKWEEMRTEALHKHYGIRDLKQREAFDDVLDEFGRKRVSIECSFFPKNPRVLNLMRRDHWLKPKPGEPHYIFHLLMQSLANGDQDNIDHIEQLVYWKYTHPEEYKLPCLIIYGEGGVGKNTFVKEVLGTIFGPHQVLVADAEKTLGQFNGLIQGKTVVMIDEAIAEKVNVERLRRTVGNRTVDVNPKYGKQGEHDNTALYLAGGNDNSGPILLAGDATDRRWSIIRVEKSIIQRLADDRKCSFDEALEVYKLMEHVYTDKEEVAKWLNYLIERWQHLEMPPSGLHKEAYQELRSVQKTAFDELMELVFIQDKQFDHISGPDLFDLYKAFSAEINPAARGVMQRNKFYSQARTWVERNTQGIAWSQLKIRTPRTHVITTANGFHKVDAGKTFTGNQEKYLVEAEQTPFWVAVAQEDMLLLVRRGEEVEGTSEARGIPITDELLSKVSSGDLEDIFLEENVS